MGKVIWVDFQGRGSKLVKRVIHDPTYISKSHIEDEEAVEYLLRELEKSGRIEESGLETCVLCEKPTDVIKETPIEQREYYIEGAGQLHPECYNKVYTHENLRDDKAWGEKFLKELRAYKQK